MNTSRVFSREPAERPASGNLHHITIQCTVYKESLAGVIDPTVKSLKIAISTYKSQGGTASIFINDDGMQLLDTETREARKKYYSDHIIGWVARPPHQKDGFHRAGRFKKVNLLKALLNKASNMNFAMNIACMVKERATQIQGHEIWTEEYKSTIYQEILKQIVNEDEFAQGAGDIRIGDIILIVDCDTRIPPDCLLHAAIEFRDSSGLGILQHKCSFIWIGHNYLEKAIVHFNELIYAFITSTVVGRNIGPFLGYYLF